MGKRCSYVYRLRHILCLNFLICLQSTIQPSVPYITNTFFAKGHGGGDCELTPSSDACRAGAVDSAFYQGWSNAASNVVGMLIAVNLGSISDTIGRRPLIRLNGVFMVFPYMALAYYIVTDSTLWIFLILRPCVHAFAVTGVFGALLQDIIPNPVDKAPAFGLLFVVMIAASAFFIPVALIMPQEHALVATLVGAALKLAYLFLLFPETAPQDAKQEQHSCLEVARRTYTIMTRQSYIYRMVVILAIFGFGSSGLQTVFPVLMRGYIGVTRFDNLFLTLAVCPSVLLMVVGALGPLVARFGQVRVLQLSFTTAIAFSVLSPRCTTVWELCILIAVLAGPSVLSIPVLISIKGTMVARDEQGLMQGSIASITKLVSILGNLFFSWLLKYSTNDGQNREQAAMYQPFLVIANVQLLALLLLCTLPATLPAADHSVADKMETELPGSSCVSGCHSVVNPA